MTRIYLREVPVINAGTYSSTAIIPANLLAPINYELRIHAGIYNVKMCSPDGGIKIPLKIESSNQINMAYTGDIVRSKLSPYINWQNSKL
jgi:hypothetical protein